MRPIPKKELQNNYSYFRELLILSELANLSLENITERLSGVQPRSVIQVQTDINRIKKTIENDCLPEEHEDELNDIIGMRDELERIPGSAVSADLGRSKFSRDQQQTINSQVASSLETDRELGYVSDDASKWFYRRLYASRLTRDTA